MRSGNVCSKETALRLDEIQNIGGVFSGWASPDDLTAMFTTSSPVSRQSSEMRLTVNTYLTMQLRTRTKSITCTISTTFMETSVLYEISSITCWQCPCSVWCWMETASPDGDSVLCPVMGRAGYLCTSWEISVAPWLCTSLQRCDGARAHS